MPSGGWVQLSNLDYTNRLAYVVDIYQIGGRFFLGLDIYPVLALHTDSDYGEMSSNDPRIVANPHVQGGVGVEHRVVEASLEEIMLWPLTKITAGFGQCGFVAKA